VIEEILILSYRDVEVVWSRGNAARDFTSPLGEVGGQPKSDVPTFGNIFFERAELG
jgi:hypothetical protein